MKITDTQQQARAIRYAIKQAKAQFMPMYVIWVGWDDAYMYTHYPYAAVTGETLDTFHAGISDDHIIVSVDCYGTIEQ